MRAAYATFVLALVLVPGCGSNPPVIPPTPIPVAPAPTAHETAPKGPDLSAIPAPGTPKPLTPKPIFTLTTKSGVKTIGITAKEIPVVHVRVVVRAGNATAVLAGKDKTRAGIANVAAELLKEGGAGRFSSRELADRVDALGTDLSVEVGPDRAVFSIAVTRDKLDAALEILGAVVTKPRFDAGEFTKLKARELDRVRQSQKGSGSWMARGAMYKELFGEGHPYADFDASEASLENITLADVKAFYKKLYVTGNAFVVVAGDIDQADVAAKLEKHLGGFAKGEAPALDWGNENAGKTGTRVILARRSSAKQADILIGSLSIPRKDPQWAELSLAVQSLGGGMSARLFSDVREKRSLAYSTTASTREFAHGPAVIAVYAGTQTPLAPKSVTALLEHLTWMRGEKPVDASELAIAKTSLETGFLFRLETIGAVAGLVVDKEILGLPGADVYDYVASYRTALREAPIEKVHATATAKLVGPTLIISVAGDGALAQPLRRFGEVRVVDPEKGFATVETLPADPNASLDVPGAK